MEGCREGVGVGGGLLCDLWPRNKEWEGGG